MLPGPRGHPRRGEATIGQGLAASKWNEAGAHAAQGLEPPKRGGLQWGRARCPPTRGLRWGGLRYPQPPAMLGYLQPRLSPCESVQRTPTTAGLFMLQRGRQRRSGPGRHRPPHPAGPRAGLGPTPPPPPHPAAPVGHSQAFPCPPCVPPPPRPVRVLQVLLQRPLHTAGHRAPFPPPRAHFRPYFRPPRPAPGSGVTHVTRADGGSAGSKDLAAPRRPPGLPRGERRVQPKLLPPLCPRPPGPGPSRGSLQ